MSMSTVLVLSCSLLLVFMGMIHETDGANFVQTTTATVYANRTQSANFRWAYQLVSGDQLQRLTCGFLEQSTNKFMVMVVKVGNSAGTVGSGSNFPTSFSGRVTVYDVGTTFGMTVSGVTVADQKSFSCRMQFSISNILQDALDSAKLLLSILDQPRFSNCLQSTDYTVIENHSFNVSCNVFGNPVPTLTCTLINDNGGVIQTFGGLKQNISLNTITNVRQTFSRVRCFADGGLAGRGELSRNIIVLHVPSKPENFRRTESTTTTIDVSWSAPNDVGGRPLLGYLVEFGENVGSLVEKNETASAFTSKLTGLASDRTYIIRLRARNNLGLGVASQISVKTVEFKEPDSGARTSSNTIIAIVVPIAVILVLVVAVAIGCYMKKKKAERKNLPVSYIEEAVGYPPTGKGMYAQVEKPAKKGAPDDAESTSGYPDILHQTKERPVEPNMNEVEYAPSSQGAPYTPMTATNGSVGHPQDDEEMSPSYENSRKEYV